MGKRRMADCPAGHTPQPRAVCHTQPKASGYHQASHSAQLFETPENAVKKI